MVDDASTKLWTCMRIEVVRTKRRSQMISSEKDEDEYTSIK